MILTDPQTILAANDIDIAYVDVPEWALSQNGDGKPTQLRLKTLSGTELEAYYRMAGEQEQNTMARLCAACIVNDAGERIFRDDQIAALGRKSGTVIRRIFERAQELNGLGRENVEAIAKNSESGPGGGS